LSFTDKNYQYETVSCAEFLEDVYSDDAESTVYLRSLSDNPRKKATHLQDDFPTIADDFAIPSVMQQTIGENYFSSPLRISSPGMTLWTHYDVMDNILVQVRGTKRVVLYHPHEVDLLYVEGSSSPILDPRAPDLERFPLYAQTRPMECTLYPGDILFLPSFFFHNITTLDTPGENDQVEPGISVNVFWRRADDGWEKPGVWADGKDLYGNRDLKGYETAQTSVEKALEALKTLPSNFERTFYLKKLILRMNKELFKYDVEE
jgi:hypothetical protein